VVTKALELNHQFPQKLSGFYNRFHGLSIRFSQELFLQHFLRNIYPFFCKCLKMLENGAKTA